MPGNITFVSPRNETILVTCLATQPKTQPASRFWRQARQQRGRRAAYPGQFD